MEIGLEIDLRLHEKSVRSACRQMKTVWDSNLRTMSMFGLISKNYQFLEKLNMVLSWTFLVLFSCSQGLTGIVQMMQKKRTFWIVFGMPLDGVKLEGILTRCSFQSFEQCIFSVIRVMPMLQLPKCWKTFPGNTHVSENIAIKMR